MSTGSRAQASARPTGSEAWRDPSFDIYLPICKMGTMFLTSPDCRIYVEDFAQRLEDIYSKKIVVNNHDEKNLNGMIFKACF